jgi:SAM-dependent methyltransferase
VAIKTEQHLEAGFGKADEKHFWWQTGSPFVGERERELSRAAFLPLGERVLDLGCAEGATLVHVGAPAGTVGIDIFEDKLAFARKQLPDVEFVNGSAYELPFEDGRFDHVLIRDVIHHLDQPERAVAEIRRVLSPGGRVDVLESCGQNPLVFLHALLNEVERGELRSTPRYLRQLFGRELDVERVDRFQAMPVHRIVFHPKMGRPALGDAPRVASLVDGFERLAAKILPEALWAYIHVRATKRG